MDITFTISVDDYAKTLREDLLITLIYVRDRNHIKEMCGKAGKSRQVIQRRLSYLLRDGLIQREVWPGTDWTRCYVLTDLGKEVLRAKRIDPNPDPDAISRWRESRRGRAELPVETRTEAYRRSQESTTRNDRQTLARHSEGGWSISTTEHPRRIVG
jgi:DNA-binding PadR family transcriptional regulator